MARYDTLDITFYDFTLVFIHFSLFLTACVAMRFEDKIGKKDFKLSLLRLISCRLGIWLDVSSQISKNYQDSLTIFDDFSRE